MARKNAQVAQVAQPAPVAPKYTNESAYNRLLTVTKSRLTDETATLENVKAKMIERLQEDPDLAIRYYADDIRRAHGGVRFLTHAYAAIEGAWREHKPAGEFLQELARFLESQNDYFIRAGYKDGPIATRPAELTMQMRDLIRTIVANLEV